LAFKRPIRRAIFRVLTVSTTLALGACTSDDLRSAVGHYEGFRVSTNSSGPTQTSIGGDLKIHSNGTLDVRLATEPSGETISFEAVISNQTITVTSSSGALPAPLHLTGGSDHCYADSVGDRLCFDGTELKVLIGSGTAATTKFVLDRMNPAAGGPSEPPPAARPYSIDELVAAAQTRNFNTRVEFDSLIQAKLSAQESYLNLLPHINIGSGLSLIGFVPTTMLRAIGDLLPFFLPDRWFQASAANHAAAAEFDSYRVVASVGHECRPGFGLLRPSR